MRINSKQELDDAFTKGQDLYVTVIEPHPASLSLKVFRKVPPIRLIKESGLDYYSISKKNPPVGYKRMTYSNLTQIFGYVFTTKEEAYVYYHSLIDEYVDEAINVANDFRVQHTLSP